MNGPGRIDGYDEVEATGAAPTRAGTACSGMLVVNVSGLSLTARVYFDQRSRAAQRKETAVGQ
jgi:hypothetical protein